MKKCLALITLFFMFLVIPVSDVDARAKSFGKSFNSSPSYTNSNPSFNKSQAAKAPGSTVKPVKKTSSKMPGWLGWLPFIGLGMMMGHFGIGSIFSILSSILLVALIIFFIKKARGGRSHYR
ncbi:hypothetical protein [Desulfolucanica intricata]|uniref:hypothetical protein n=1 Tax=Desulfolucanica intricata TaxID=1285191 RepID=UPI0008370821|nr:hypothetical protein [Desulfolucanica intricata]